MKKAKLPANFFSFDFKCLAKKEKNAALKVRYLALSHVAAGKTVLEAAAIVHKSNRMLHRWINRLADFGIDGLKDRIGRGRTLYLSREKEDEFKNIVLRFLKENNRAKITGYDMQYLLKSHYSINCTLPTAYSVLTRLHLNLSKKDLKRKVQLKPCMQLRAQ